MAPGRAPRASGQGRHYPATKALLACDGVVQSRIRRGNGDGNAPAESPWGRLKTELLDGRSFRNLNKAQLETSHCRAFYNAERRRCAPGCLALDLFETHFRTTSQRCAA